MTKAKTSRRANHSKAISSLTTPSSAAVKSKGWTLQTPPDLLGRTHDQFMAGVATAGIVGNARSVVAFGQGTFGELSLTDCAMVLTETAGKYNDGDLSAAVSMLSSQAVALNAMFGELARRSALNMGEHLEATERYMRLALRAQGQCRATLETLAAIKNPPVVFARQANINNGGQQQVNNGLAQNSGVSATNARARESEIAQSKLLENSNGERLDCGTQGAASGANPELATLGAIYRPAYR